MPRSPFGPIRNQVDVDLGFLNFLNKSQNKVCALVSQRFVPGLLLDEIVVDPLKTNSSYTSTNRFDWECMGPLEHSHVIFRIIHHPSDGKHYKLN